MRRSLSPPVEKKANEILADVEKNVVHAMIPGAKQRNLKTIKPQELPQTGPEQLLKGQPGESRHINDKIAESSSNQIKEKRHNRIQAVASLQAS